MEPAQPFRFTRESRISIDRDGHVWHEGLRVTHPRLEEAFLSWLDWDDSSQRWVLRNTLDWCFITVEHTPLVVRSVSLSPNNDSITLGLSDGTTETLAPDTLRFEPDGKIYARAKSKRIPVLFDRHTSFTLASWVTADTPELTLCGHTLSLRPIDPTWLHGGVTDTAHSQ